nr:hypothetical protein [Acinetobacter baumannii]
MDKCREEFEEYFKEHHADSFYSVDVALEMRGDDYIDFLASDLWAIWQHQQAKVEELQTQLSLQRQRVKAFEEELTSSRNYGDELQKRVDAATKQAQNALQYVEEDMRGNHEFLQMAMIRTFKDLEQALKGEGQ